MNSSSAQPIMIDLNIGDQLTSISCGHVVVEFVKFIAYQRLQIPYTYHWLKQMINKRKNREEENINESLISERHFRVASSALQNIDLIVKSLQQEISTSIPEEVCIVLGSDPITCREVYRLLLPTACHQLQCHSPHIASDQKIQLNVFKELVTSEKLNKVFFNPMPPTNTYIFVKRKTVNQEVVLNHDHYTFTSGHRIPRSSKLVIIDFRCHNKGKISCCNNFEVYGETKDQDLLKLKFDESVNETDDYREIESTDSMKWYQSNYVVKGFKDCFVDGSSVSNSWFQS